VLRNIVVASILALVVASFAMCQTNSDTQTFAITSRITVLYPSDLVKLPNSDNLSKKGELNAGDVRLMIDALFPSATVAPPDSETVVIFHTLGWKDKDHTAANFDKWYVYDPHSHTYDLYVKSAQQLLEGTIIAGQRKFRLVYLHFNADLNPTGTDDESITSCPEGYAPPCLKHPVAYNVVVSKQQTQFIQDLHTVLGIVGVPVAAVHAAPPQAPLSVGYWSYSDFTSQYTTSSIKITASLTAAQKTVVGRTADSGSQNAASNALATQTYANEKPSYVGLSFAVPVTSYKDVTYQSSTGTLVPSSITQQKVYVTFDVYLPPAQPGLAAFRWIPHPFVGLPIKGKVLQHTMAGLAVGLPWFEPFAGIVFDRQNAAVNNTSQRTTFKGIFGFKVSVSAVAKALKK